jgi:plastocyanin
MWKARVFAVATLVTVAGCSGGGDDGGGGTGPEPVFTSLTITPTNPTVAPGGTTTLTATAKDQSNNTMSGLQVTYTSGNTAIATVTNAGVVTGVAVGSAQITATGVIGSVTKTQTVTVTVAVPGATASVSATTQNSFDPKTVTITRGGTVTWNFATLHDVTFDTQGAPGDIAARATGSAALTFQTAGTFNYHCTIHGTGMNGTVVVQ